MKNLFLFFFGALLLITSNAYSTRFDSTEFKHDEERKKTKTALSSLPYFMDDILLVGGLSYGGIYMSNNFRELSYIRGYNIGIESYVPITQNAFLNYGLHYSQRGFRFRQEETINNYLDFPLFFSFELPELKAIDFRFLLGGQLSYRLASNWQNSSESFLSPEEYPYAPQNLNNLDFGWTFGLSGEYGSIYFRARSYLGFNKVIPSDQGMRNSFHFDIGFFFLRGLRK